MRRIDFLDQNKEAKLKKLYEHLSSFIHIPEEYVLSVKHSDLLKDVMVACPATTYFNVDSLKAWSDSFERVFGEILKIIVEYHPFTLKTDSGKLAINQLRSIEEKFGISEKKTISLLYNQLVLPHLS